MNNLEFKELELEMNNGKDTVTVFTAVGVHYTYYCQEGAMSVNMTYDEINDGDSLDEINDIDIMSFTYEINSIKDLENALCY